jgi:hypothetical protein
MTESGVYHVLRLNDDAWQVLKEGFKRPHILGRTKQEAIVLAKRIARGVPESVVVVHSSDHSIERRYWCGGHRGS